MAKTERIELPSLGSTGQGVLAAFEWASGSFQSTIHAVADGTTTPLLILDVATPIQEIVRHMPPNGQPALLLTGAGANCYWSGAITAMADESYPRLSFDLACRRKGDAPTPVVRYQLAAGVISTSQDEQAVLLTLDGREFALSSECTLTKAGQDIYVESPVLPEHLRRDTLQWRYDIAASSSD
jgi:hypothetical protein